ncbi:MAG TPA: sensor histidine kinase KdpD [Candidatus Polarisedimenticolia bacterium]|jgi:two-component system sensor histidine kinase KdpD|nr:sensor histidine kinase KdpD [Candidatus Polarisedimenticolia bacterium]
MTSPAGRPDPDALLRRVKAEETRQSRTRLKIFFGFAPGVGKTYKMLESAQELQAAGEEVVVGYVDTHGRCETAALLEGLEILPRRRVSYRGAEIEEFDLDEALKRKPGILLLDELAHTNAEGLRHAKRWQDALELLDAGIEVHTTLNVQHIESLNDIVAQITSIRVRETVPDAVIDRADDIELIDLTPEELLERLHEGKVYLPEQAARAAEHFFQRGNLLTLRELALRRTAERVDADVQAYRQEHDIRQTWPAAERILVCVGPSASSSRLVRKGRLMAAGLRAPWTVAHVETTAAGPLASADRERLESHLRLAETLGGEVIRLSGGSVSEVLLEYARRNNVTRILIGKPTHSRLRDVLFGSVLDEVVRGSGEIDVHVIAGEEKTAEERPAGGTETVFRAGWPAYAWATVLVALATGAAGLVRTFLALPDLVMLYLLVIMIAAIRFGRGPSVLAAALSVGLFDFFFVPPYLTFDVGDTRHILTFGMMFAVGLVISELTLRVRRQEQEARLREERTRVLYNVSRDLGSALDDKQVAEAAARHAAEIFGGGAAILLPGNAGNLELKAKAGSPLPLDVPELGVARWVLEHGRPAGPGTDTLPGARLTCIPIQASASALGVLAVASDQPALQQAEQRHFLEALVRQIALALERARLAEEAKSVALRARTEEMRSSLLSAVSHDLRTPLGAITGAATTLRDESEGLDATERAELLDTLCEEAERLERLVGNLLDMTRLESGTLEPKREWVPLEEIVGSALTRLDRKLEGREVSTEVPDGLPLLSADPVLLEQAFVNLLENAVKHTPAGSPIEIRARNSDDAVEVDVSDRGPGLPPGSESQIFEKFHRGPQTGARGTGLGLAIARGIVQAHGGTLTAENRAGGGAVFRMTLPQTGTAPSMPEAAVLAPPGEASGP